MLFWKWGRLVVVERANGFCDGSLVGLLLTFHGVTWCKVVMVIAFPFVVVPVRRVHMAQAEFQLRITALNPDFTPEIIVRQVIVADFQLCFVAVQELNIDDTVPYLPFDV